LRGPSHNWSNGTLIYLGVRDEMQLVRWTHKLELKQIQFTEFREPDIGNELTAVAAVADDRLFKSLNLL